MAKIITPEEKAFKKHLGRNIAIYRKALDWTQAELAELVKVEMETVSRIERGATMPSVLTLRNIARQLKVTVADLLAESEPGIAEEERQLQRWVSGLPEDKRRFVVEHMLGLCRVLGGVSR